MEGAMYAFPQVHFSKKFLKHARGEGKNADTLYCMELLEKTGIMVVPGSGFGQKEGTFHFRITNLMTPTTKMEQVLERLKVFNEDFHQRWET
jgi:alanine transaminase